MCGSSWGQPLPVATAPHASALSRGHRDDKIPFDGTLNQCALAAGGTTVRKCRMVTRDPHFGGACLVAPALAKSCQRGLDCVYPRDGGTLEVPRGVDAAEFADGLGSWAVEQAVHVVRGAPEPRAHDC